MFSKYITTNSPDLSAFFLRLALGITFVVAGYLKLTDISTALSFFASVHVPIALAYLVTLIEFVGGVLMLLGFFTEYIAWLFAIIMFFAIILYTGSKGFAGYELHLVLLLAALAKASLPDGKWSLFRFFGRSR